MDSIHMLCIIRCIGSDNVVAHGQHFVTIKVPMPADMNRLIGLLTAAGYTAVVQDNDCLRVSTLLTEEVP